MLLPQLKHGQAAASIVAAAGTGHCHEPVHIMMSRHNSKHTCQFSVTHLVWYLQSASNATKRGFDCTKVSKYICVQNEGRFRVPSR
jgi:hypothetical protein